MFNGRVQNFITEQPDGITNLPFQCNRSCQKCIFIFNFILKIVSSYKMNFNVK